LKSIEINPTNTIDQFKRIIIIKHASIVYNLNQSISPIQMQNKKVGLIVNIEISIFDT
jgi:hypothetical protein